MQHVGRTFVEGGLRIHLMCGLACTDTVGRLPSHQEDTGSGTLYFAASNCVTIQGAR